MPDEHDPAATAVLPVIPPDDGPELLTHSSARAGWRARSVLFDVTTQRLVGPPARARFPVSSGLLDLDGSVVTGLELRARESDRPSTAYRALLGRATPAEESPGLSLRCSAAPARRRLAGELLVGGLSRLVSLRIKLLDVQQQRVLIWLTGQVRIPVRERRLGHTLPRLHIAAEFIR